MSARFSCTLSWELAKMEIYDPLFINFLATNVVHNTRRMSEMELVQTFFAFCKIQREHPKMKEKVVKRISDRILKKYDSFEHRS